MKETAKKKSVFRRVMHGVGVAVMLILVAALLFVIYSNIRGDVTFIGGKTVVWVMTGSMKPTIPDRSYVLMEKADPKTLSVGDVILFYSDDPTLHGELNTHRIIEIIGDHEEFVTQGDNNEKKDDYTAKADKVVAVYRKNLPFLTGVGRFLATPAGLTTLALVLLGIMAAIYVPDLVQAAREKKKEDEKHRQEKLDELVRAEVERMKASEEAKMDGNTEANDEKEEP